VPLGLFYSMVWEGIMMSRNFFIHRLFQIVFFIKYGTVHRYYGIKCGLDNRFYEFHSSVFHNSMHLVFVTSAGSCHTLHILPFLMFPTLSYYTLHVFLLQQEKVVLCLHLLKFTALSYCPQCTSFPFVVPAPSTCSSGNL